jgi:hypothetical protein
MFDEHPVGQKNRQKILSALKQLNGSASPTQILEQIVHDAETHVELYQNGAFLLPAEKSRLVKEHSMTEQALFNNLKKLVEKRILENRNGIYHFSDKTQSDIRYFAPIFGRYALSALHQFPAKPVDKALSEFIERYGAFIIFAFIEASRPVKDKDMSPREKDGLALSWMRYAIPLQEMFDAFQIVFRSRPRKYGKLDQPYFDLDEESIEALTETFRKSRKYGRIYHQLLEVRADWLGEPKERSLSKNCHKPGSFQYENKRDRV